jgi:hypothetical protein
MGVLASGALTDVEVRAYRATNAEGAIEVALALRGTAGGVRLEDVLDGMDLVRCVFEIKPLVASLKITAQVAGSHGLVTELGAGIIAMHEEELVPHVSCALDLRHFDAVAFSAEIALRVCNVGVLRPGMAEIIEETHEATGALRVVILVALCFEKTRPGSTRDFMAACAVYRSGCKAFYAAQAAATTPLQSGDVVGVSPAGRDCCPNLVNILTARAFPSVWEEGLDQGGLLYALGDDATDAKIGLGKRKDSAVPRVLAQSVQGVQLCSMTPVLLDFDESVRGGLQDVLGRFAKLGVEAITTTFIAPHLGYAPGVGMAGEFRFGGGGGNQAVAGGSR